MKNMDSKRIKILYTALFFLNTLAMGISSTIVWPTLVDLGQIYNVDMKQVDKLPMYSQIGFAFGSLSGFFYKSIDEQLYQSFTGAVCALTIFFVPFYPNLDCLNVAILACSFGQASWFCSVNVWVINMWPEQKGPIVNALSLVWCIGAVIGAALVAPFVFGAQNVKPEIRKNWLAIPFTITALIQAICPMMLFVLHGIKPLKSNDDSILGDEQEQKQQQQQQLPVNRSWRKTKLLFVTMSMTFYCNSETVFTTYSTRWLQKFENFTATEAANAMSCLNGAEVVGKISIIFISLILSQDTILTYHFFILILSLIMQRTMVKRGDHIPIYVINVLRGYGFSGMYSALLLFASNNLKLTNRIMSFFAIFTALFNIPAIILISHYLETDSAILFKAMSVYITISVVSFTCAKLLTSITDSESDGNQNRNHKIYSSMDQTEF